MAAAAPASIKLFSNSQHTEEKVQEQAKKPNIVGHIAVHVTFVPTAFYSHFLLCFKSCKP